MKNLLIWYLPQAGLLIFGFAVSGDLDPPISGLARLVTGVMLAAAYTGGVNLIISLIARLRAYRSQPRREIGGLGAGSRLLGDSPQNRQRIRVDQKLR